MEAEQLERLDRVRGLIPREAFVKQVIQDALDQLEEVLEVDLAPVPPRQRLARPKKKVK
jgi:hypothetical protein